MDVINDFFLEELCLEPTRGKAILDLILSNTRIWFKKVFVGKPLCKSNQNNHVQQSSRRE